MHFLSGVRELRFYSPMLRERWKSFNNEEHEFVIDSCSHKARQLSRQAAKQPSQVARQTYL